MDYNAHPREQGRSQSAPRKTVTLPDFLDEQQLNRAMACQNHRELVEKIIQPNLDEINQRLGQENDPDYIGFMVEYVFRQAGIWR